MKVYAPPIPAPEWGPYNPDKNYDAYFEADEAYMRKVAEMVKEYGDYPLAGKTVSVPFADGRAYYAIAKINGRVSLVHIPVGDAWRDGRFERLCTVAELKRMVAEQDL